VNSEILSVPLYATAKGQIMKKDLLREPLQVINVGLEGFFRDLKKRGTPAVHVEWSPPAGGNRKMRDLLSKLGD
jgi:FdrA protein